MQYRFSLGYITGNFTLHPIVVYCRDREDSTSDVPLICKRVCIICDEREHNVIAVNKFIEVIMNSLKVLLPNLRSVQNSVQMSQPVSIKSQKIF